MKYLAIKNHDEHQHYKNRGVPWIKLYARVLDDDAFMLLAEAAQAQLMKLWVLASRMGHPLPNRPAFLAGKIGTKKLRIAELLASGFLIETNTPPKSEQPPFDEPEPSRESLDTGHEKGAHLSRPLVESEEEDCRSTTATALTDPPPKATNLYVARVAVDSIEKAAAMLEPNPGPRLVPDTPFAREIA